MATRKFVTFISDLSGEPADPDTATVQFALDGTNYEIDLTAGEQRQLRALLQPFISEARRNGMAHQVAPGALSDNPAIRAWGIENGFDVPARGRVPAPVREAYEASHR